MDNSFFNSFSLSTLLASGALSALIAGIWQYFAKQKGKSYPEKSGLDMNMYYIIDGTIPFKTVTGSTTELYKVVPVEKFEK